MTLTVVVGSSGSGKTTFLGDVHKLNKCCYVRQYHTLRPYIPVRKIPHFDSSELPYMHLYNDEQLEGKKNDSYNPGVMIGGTMAGETTAGLSGGQRKMMLFELVRQRTASSSNLLICLDEPFAGVTDDFLPYIMERLSAMREQHNVLLVTNDHVKALTDMADTTITVSAIDRTKIKVDDKPFDRELALHAVALGNNYEHTPDSTDLWFFAQTELLTNPQVGAVMGFTIFAMILFSLSFWDSPESFASLVMVALQIICFFALNPFLIALPDWRNTMTEEAEALMHFSVSMNLALKSVVTLLLLLTISGIAFGCLNLCIDNLSEAKYWVYMLFDSASLTLPFICFGLYSSLPLQIVQILASLPFLFMIFFSTTFSPGSGVALIKEFRFLFPRFYFWCDMPGVKEAMEDCPAQENLLWLTVVTGCLGMILFLLLQLVLGCYRKRKSRQADGRRAQVAATPEFAALQQQLFKDSLGGLKTTGNSAGPSSGRGNQVTITM